MPRPANPYNDRLGLDREGGGYAWATHEGVEVIGDFHHFGMVGIVWPPELSTYADCGAE